MKPLNKMHIDVFMRHVRMVANDIWIRYYLNYTNLLPGSEEPQILALQIANITKSPYGQINAIEDDLIKEGFELWDRECVNGIWLTTFIVEKSMEIYEIK